MFTKVFFSAVVMSLLLLACAKSNESDREVNPENKMEGSWVYTEHYVSPGMPWHWAKVADGGIIKISPDSTYEVTRKKAMNQWPFSILKDSGKIGIALNKTFNSNMTYILPDHTTDTAFIWPIRVSKDTLEIALLCIEGCIYRFRKM